MNSLFGLTFITSFKTNLFIAASKNCGMVEKCQKNRVRYVYFVGNVNFVLVVFLSFRIFEIGHLISAESDLENRSGIFRSTIVVFYVFFK